HHLISTWTLSGYQTPDFLMQAAAPTKLQLILPNQVSVPGNIAALGVSGTPTTAVAGEIYDITVRVTDNWYNGIGNSSLGTTIHLVTTDPFAPGVADLPIAAGTSNFSTHFSSYKFQTASLAGWTVTASTSSGPLYTTISGGPV